MKRGMSGRGRGGSPPLPRQRVALRVVQVSLIGLAIAAGFLAWQAWQSYSHGPPASSLGRAPASLSEFLGLSAAALIAAAIALWMGFRVVRGPRPPELG